MKQDMKDKQTEQKPYQTDSPALEQQLPIVISARTGLASQDDAIMRRIPTEYGGKSVREALEYVTGGAATDEELPFVDSIKRELSARGSVVVANGKTSDLTDRVEKYLVEKSHELPNGEVSKYHALEIEVSAVQQGGYF